MVSKVLESDVWLVISRESQWELAENSIGVHIYMMSCKIRPQGKQNIIMIQAVPSSHD